MAEQTRGDGACGSARFAASKSDVGRPAVERLRQLVGQPLGRLERPPAPDAPHRVGRHRGVPDEREPGAARPPGRVRHLELAEDLRDPLAGRQIGRFGSPRKYASKFASRSRLNHDSRSLVWNVAIKRDPVVLRKRVGDVGVEQPQHASSRRSERQVSVVREIAEATVPHHPSLLARQLGDPRVAAVRRDDHPSRDLTFAPLAVDDPHARRPCARAEQGLGRLPEQSAPRPAPLPRARAPSDRASPAGCRTRSAGRRSRRPVADGSTRTESRARHRCERRRPPRSARPARAARSPALRSADEVRADRLVRRRVRPLLQQSDARPCPPEQRRRSAPGEARAHHHHVVIRRHGSTP